MPCFVRLLMKNFDDIINKSIVKKPFFQRRPSLLRTMAGKNSPSDVAIFDLIELKNIKIEIVENSPREIVDVFML